MFSINPEKEAVVKIVSAFSRHLWIASTNQQVVEGVYCKASRTVKRGVRGLLKSYPGQKVLQGLNSSIDVAEKILESVQGLKSVTSQNKYIQALKGSFSQ